MDPTYDLPSEDEYRPQPRLPIRLLIALAVAVATAALGGGAYYLLTRKDVDDHLRDAQIYLDKGDGQAAMIELKNALQREPSHAEARFRLGQLHFSLHDFLAAEKELKLAREQGHRGRELPLLLARSWLALGQPERVLEALPVSEGSGPDDAAPLLALHARAHWLRNDRAAAQQALEQAEALRAGDPEVLITRAMMAVDAAQPEQALALIDQALGQDAKRALQYLGKAHTLAPDAPEIHYHLAAAQAAAGDRKAALASLERLLSGKREFAQQAEAARLFDQLNPDCPLDRPVPSMTILV